MSLEPPRAHTRVNLGVVRRRRKRKGGPGCSWQRPRSRTSTASRVSSPPRVPRSASSTARRARSCSATLTRPTGSGSSSTGISTAGRASPPTLMSRRSCRRLGTRAGRRCRRSAAATRRRSEVMREAINVGVIADQTGALSPRGGAQANTATLVADEINASGGLLGRRLELLVEDSASDDAQAAAAATKLVQDDHVDVLLGGIFSSTRQAIKDPAVVDGETLYIYPEQYEGQEYHSLLFCTGAVPAQQVEPLIPWVMQQTGARTFYLPSADYIWPHVMNRKVHEVASANGGKIVGEEYYPDDHADCRGTVDRINDSGAHAVFNTTVPPGCFPFLEALCESGFTKRGGRVITTYFEENLVAALPSEHTEGLYGCIDYYQSVGDPFSTELLGRYNLRFPHGP